MTTIHTILAAVCAAMAVTTYNQQDYASMRLQLFLVVVNLVLIKVYSEKR